MNLEAATEAYDAALAEGLNKAQALGAAADVTGEHINDVFNAMLAADILRFVAVDKRHFDKKNPEGRPLVRVINPNGRRIINHRLVD